MDRVVLNFFLNDRIFFFSVKLSLIIFFYLSTPGCSAVLVGTIVAIVSASGGDGGDSTDIPPTISSVSNPKFLESPDRIQVDFTIINEDAGNLSAQVHVVQKDDNGNDRGSPSNAQPLPEAVPLDVLSTQLR